MASRPPIDWGRVSRGETVGEEATEAGPSGMWSWSDAPDSSGQWPAMAAEGRYVRGTVLAEGGMGAVHLAEDPLLRRQVALKVLRSGADSREAQLLLREARITAALRHPGVAGVLDAGVDSQGRPWFAMPVVPGRTLGALLHATGVTPVESLRALADAADILGHAHKAGIVHRDVKPANLMVSSNGDVVVLDWGIARPEAATTEWDSLLTRADGTGEDLLGTPAYMSPEQIIGDNITACSDVWSLGVCLVEIVDGALPFAGGDVKEVMRAVVHGPLPRLDGPLGELITASLSRDPEHRPADGHAFAQALRAAMAPQVKVDPSEARPGGTAFSVAILALLVGLGVGMTMFWLLRPAPQSNPLLSHTLGLLARTAALADARPTAELASAAGLKSRAGDPAVFRGILAAQTPEVRPLDRTEVPSCRELVTALDGSTLVCVQDERLIAFDLPSMGVRWQHPDALTDVVWVGDGVMGSRKDTHLGGLVLYDGRTGTSHDGISGQSSSHALQSSWRQGRTVATSGDGRGLLLLDIFSTKDADYLTAPGSLDVGVVLSDGSIVAMGTDAVYRWTPDLGAMAGPAVKLKRHALTADDSPFNVAASSDGRWVLEGSLSGAVRLWDLQEDALVEMVQLVPGMVRSLAISSDARWIAAVDELGKAWVWPRGQPQARLQLPGFAKIVVFPSPDRLRIVGTMVETWALPEVTLPHVLDAGAGVSAIDWAGEWVAAAVGNGHVRRWSTITGELESVSFVVTQDKVVKDVSLNESGAVFGGSLQANDAGKHMEIFWPDQEVPVDLSGCRRVVWLAQGGMACMYTPPGPTVFSLDGTVYDALRRPTVALLDMEMAAERRTAVLIDGDSSVLRLSWEGAEPELEVVVRNTSGSVVAAGGPGGEVIATSDRSSVSLYTGGESPVRTWPTKSYVTDLAVSPDGRRVAAGLGSGEVMIWDVDSDSAVAYLVGHRERVSAVWFSPDGRQLLTGSWDETVRLWNMSVLDLPDDALIRQVEARWGRTAVEAFTEWSPI